MILLMVYDVFFVRDVNIFLCWICFVLNLWYNIIEVKNVEGV